MVLVFGGRDLSFKIDFYRYGGDEVGFLRKNKI